MKSYKPLVEKRNAGRRLPGAGKRRPLDAVDTFEQNAARAGLGPDQLDRGTRTIARASALVATVKSGGFEQYFQDIAPQSPAPNAPGSAPRYASEGLRLAKRPDAADVIDRAIALYADPAPAPDTAAIEELNAAFARADSRADLQDALNDYLVDNPQLFEITEDDLSAAWEARAAAAAPASGSLADLPGATGERLKALATTAGLNIRNLRFAPLATGAYRIEEGDTRYHAARTPAEHPRGGPILDGWALTNSQTGQIIATDPDPQEPDPEQTAQIIEHLALTSHGLPESRARALLAGNPLKAFAILRTRRLFAPRAFFRLQLAAGEVMPGLQLAQNAFLNGLFVAFLIAILLPFCLRALVIAASHLPSPLGVLLVALLLLGVLYILAQTATYAIAQIARFRGWRLRDQPPARFAPTDELSDHFAY